METPNNTQPNLAEAIKFLNALAGSENEVFIFQTFDDNQSEGAEKRHALTNIITGTLAEHADTLVKLNQAGAGIFVQINIADGNGRKAQNINALRAVFVDKDDGNISGMKLKPSILVQTKHGQHAYWRLISGESIDRFKAVQKALIHHLHTDKSVHNLDRVMRLPGFFHQKDPSNPFMVTIVETNNLSYKLDDITAPFPIPMDAIIKKKRTSDKSDDKTKSKTNTKVDKFKRWVAKQPIDEGGRNATVVKIVREGLGQGITDDVLYEVVEDYCERSGLPTEEGIKILERHIAEHENENFEAYQDLDSRPMYEVINNCIYWNKPTPDGSVPTALCNFDARIVKEESQDDGAEKKKFFQITGKHTSGYTFPTISVTAEEFSTLNWITKNWGQKAVVYVGKNDHLRVAIQMLSGITVENISVFRHTGWREINTKYLYLHADGAIGASGTDLSVQVDLKSGKLADYRLPNPPHGDHLRLAIQASMTLLTTSPKHISYTLMAAVYRSVLAECKPVDFSIFVSGHTGCFKSSLMGAVQAHFGDKFSTTYLPDNWTSTENSLEKKSFLLKDSIFTIDEWTANGTHADADRLRAKAERILRSQGNQSGRGRMTSDCEMRPAYFPRGIIVSTGEDMPPGQSLRARTVQIEMSHGDVDKAKLTVLQKDAANGLLSQSLAAYIQWLAPQMTALKIRVPRLQKRLRDSIISGKMHSRTPDITASLGVGLWMFLKFAVQSGAISKLVKRELWREGWAALNKIAEMQSRYQTAEDHTTKFINYIKYALNMGEAYVVNARTGDVSPEFGGRSGSQCKKIGWSDGNEIYLDPDAAFALVQQLARQQNEALTITKNTLWKRLAEKRLIVASDTEHRNTLKRTVESRRIYVLVFSDKSVFLETGERQSNRPMSNGAHPGPTGAVS